MAGMSMGIAAAANYPAPFVTGGSANAAVIHGTGSGVSALDSVWAGNIQTSLAGSVTIGGSTEITEGGDSYTFAKTSTAFHLGDGYTTIKSTIDKDELTTLLADGKLIDNDNDEIDYTQKIVMASANTLTMFDEDDYMADTPTIGFKMTDGATIATYTLTFSDPLLMSDLSTSDLPMMGKTYYVLSNTSSTLTLLDSATETVLAEGETTTIDGKTVTLDFISGTEVKFNVDGEITNSLAETNTFKLLDGSYIGVKDITSQDYQGGIKKVEFSIGSGKLKLTDDDVEVQINDINVAGVESDFDLTGDVLSNIEIVWKANDDQFVTESSSITMPGFEAVSLSFGGLTYPVEETIEVKGGGTTYAELNNFPFKTGVKSINFLWGDSTSFTGIGKDANNLLLTDAVSTDGGVADINITFNSSQDDYFVASWTNIDSAQSYLMRATNFVTDSNSVDRVDIQYWKDGDWADALGSAKETDEISLDGIYLTIGNVSNGYNTVELWNTSVNTDTSITSFNTLYSKEGMTVYLPWQNSSRVILANTTGYASDALACAQTTQATGELYTGIITYNKSTSAADLGSLTNTTAGIFAQTFEVVMKEE